MSHPIHLPDAEQAFVAQNFAPFATPAHKRLTTNNERMREFWRTFSGQSISSVNDIIPTKLVLGLKSRYNRRAGRQNFAALDRAAPHGFGRSLRQSAKLETAGSEDRDDACKPVSAEGTTYSASAGRSFLLPGDGRELDGNFAGLPMDGDFHLTARLVERKGPDAMMGVTVRERVDDNPRALAMTLGETGRRQARFRTRADAGGKVTTRLGNDYTWLPVWMRLQREGNTFTAFQSSDGIEWFEVGKIKVDLPRECLVGLLASTGQNPPGTKREDAPYGLFDHVSVERALPVLPTAPGSLKASRSGDGLVQLDWKNAPNSTQAGVKVEASLDGAPFYEIADLAANATRFENTGLKNPAALRYRLRAYNRSGYSSYSAVVP